MSADPLPRYRGRFAPSPTGPLHLGSLLAALASYLDARAHGGSWLLRIEDIDPPREWPGAAQLIIDSLLAHGLRWDENILYQSRRGDEYARSVAALLARGSAYYCTCSRQELDSGDGEHAPDCARSRDDPGVPASIRIIQPPPVGALGDDILGDIELTRSNTAGDTVLRRKDGLYAYQLAVVVDDAFQGITHVVRGRDLLQSTLTQMHIRQLLQLPPIRYAHLPLLVSDSGQKLSKQNLAAPLDAGRATENLRFCLSALGQPSPPAEMDRDSATLLGWAQQHWQRRLIPTANVVHHSR
jgi:glutamyl-Q tRNA(Asp) synthetase